MWNCWNPFDKSWFEHMRQISQLIHSRLQKAWLYRLFHIRHMAAIMSVIRQNQCCFGASQNFFQLIRCEVLERNMAISIMPIQFDINGKIRGAQRLNVVNAPVEPVDGERVLARGVIYFSFITELNWSQFSTMTGKIHHELHCAAWVFFYNFYDFK